MTCRELEALFLSDAPASAVAAHRSRCAECEAAARGLEVSASLTSALHAPAWSPELRHWLLSIPSRTLSCEHADEAIAAALEGELGPEDRRRLDFHLGRCAACAEASWTLAAAGDLVAPPPAPWFAAKVAASRPAPRKRSPLAWLFGAKGAIAAAYAAAVLVMILGFNPADVARANPTGRLKQETRAVVRVAGSSLADRLGAFGERAYRAAAIVRGRFGGYGRAAISNALNLVMKPEAPPPSNRPRSGDDKGAPEKSQTELTTWRA